MPVSDSTLQNWKKLNTDTGDRLKRRANKTRSEKLFIPYERLSAREGAVFTESIVIDAQERGCDTGDLMYTLCCALLAQNYALNREGGRRFWEEYGQGPHAYELLPEFAHLELPPEFDLLGTVYQSLITEGYKNANGSYFTPRNVIREMLKGLKLTDQSEFLDPCCGSGAFLMAANHPDPCRLHGYETDPIAVMICKANLLALYPGVDFYPDIRQLDFINPLTFERAVAESDKADVIATNPPWGADIGKMKTADISTGESASLFFTRAFAYLKEGGAQSFLLPSSVLNVRAHQDLRRFILKKTRFLELISFKDLFEGVTTDCIAVTVAKDTPSPELLYRRKDSSRKVRLETFEITPACNFMVLSDTAAGIIRKMKEKGGNTLQGSVFALGIVTGDNKNKLCHTPPSPDWEPIYTGVEIKPYVLKPPFDYILYERKAMQQAAPDAVYRAPEKLVYKFISKKLVFAYDSSRALFLNSANIIIPKVPGLSIKTLCAVLNHPALQYYYMKLFGEVKILKKNLLELPLPALNAQQDAHLTALTDTVLKGDLFAEKDAVLFLNAFYGFTQEELAEITAVTGCKI